LVSYVLYNLTNPNEALAGARPTFAEYGPVVYEQRTEKYAVTFLADGVRLLD
jgi:hypothetical protein